MITISLCMIVNNEENLLERCLHSYRDLFDEIIIVDTGSTDNTKAIAAKYTNNIFDFKWIDDFAAARNFASSKASCDYIFSADADEVLDDTNRAALLNLKSVLLPEIDIVQMKYVNSGEFNTVYNFKKEYRPKLFKRLRTFEWVSPIHETLRLKPIIYDSDIEILHLPDHSHTNRDFHTFTDAVKRGIHLENYVLIMFCKELFISGTDEDFLAVRDIFEQVLANDYTDEDCQQNISCVLARIYRLAGDYNSFFKICLKDIAVNPCAEICMELGNYYFSLTDYEEAVLWFINASSETQSIIDIHSSGDLPLIRLADCYEALAQQAKSVENLSLYETYYANYYSYLNQAKAWAVPDEL